MNEITFNEIPQAIKQLFDRLESIEKLILQNIQIPQADSDEILTVKGAAELLRLSVATVYVLISKGQLPVMKRSKRCYFLKTDLVNYLKAGRKNTLNEIDIKTDNFLIKSKNKL